MAQDSKNSDSAAQGKNVKTRKGVQDSNPVDKAKKVKNKQAAPDFMTRVKTIFPSRNVHRITTCSFSGRRSPATANNNRATVSLFSDDFCFHN